MSAPVGPDRPVVALVVSPGGSTALRPLTRALARDVDLGTGRGRPPDAVVASDAAAARRAPPGAPVAVVHGDRLHLPPGGTTAHTDHGPLALPLDDGVRTASWPPVAPHVRRRWRARLALPDDLVVDTDTLDESDVPTALAVAAAARVAAHHLPLALALGCPTATDASAAAEVGATSGDQVVVGGPAEARALAAADVAAARLSRRAAELARALDAEVAAAAVLQRLGLAPGGPVARARAALDELGTAPGAAPRARTAAALALFADPDLGRTPPVHPAIDPDRAAHLADAPPPVADLPPSVGARTRAVVRRLGGSVLDRVGDRAAAATGREVDALRDELERTRAALEAEIALLRAELEARDVDRDGSPPVTGPA